MENESKTKKIFKKIGIIAFVCMAIFIGKIVGDILVSAFFTKNTASAYTEAEVRDDEEAIYADYLAGKIKFEDLTTEDIAKAIIIATYNTYNSDYFKITASGTVTASIATQTLTGSYEKDGNICNVKELSNGFIKVANKVVYDISTGESKVYKGKMSQDGNASFSDSYEKYTAEEFKEKYGNHPRDFYAHIFSSKTIVEGKMTSVAEGLKFEIKLDTEKSTVSYKTKITANSGAKNIKFNYINFTFIIDKDFKFVKYSVAEEYSAILGIQITCTSKIDSIIQYSK